jgi:hypothetical protein
VCVSSGSLRTFKTTVAVETHPRRKRRFGAGNSAPLLDRAKYLLGTVSKEQEKCKFVQKTG